jgi:pimeloyl-ACP methyl ester carboxylesterase/DNA-binding winged helix-turn-helix (wHTH) protein
VWQIPRVVLAFGDDLELDTAQFELRRAGRPVPMEPQAFDVLTYLVAHRDRVVAKEELMDAVWGGRFVAETAVTSRIKQVRRAVGDDGQAQRLIRTVHGRGYRFVAPVHGGAAPAAGERRSAGAGAPIRYTVSDGLHVAYQVTGGGDRDVILIPGFLSHLELDWGDPRHAHFLDRLGSMGRLIRFDKRGTGMSDRPPGVPDLETRMHDVLAVMDAVDSRRAVLCGYSEGGPMAVLLAATHPERVSSLVLYASYAKRVWSPDYPWARTPRMQAEVTERLVTGWDWEADCRWRCPSADEDMQRWWAQRMRAAATPSTVRALLEMNALVDVRKALPAVRVPTLVLHRTGDPLFHVAEARYLAEHIPGARLELLPGADHLVCGNPDQILDAIEAFLAGPATGRPEPALALAAVAAAAGHTADALVAELVAAGGRPRHDRSGRAVVLFDGPAKAVRAGLAHLSTGARMGLSIAEVPRDSDRLDGPGVAAAARLADTARPGCLLVSSTVGVLLSGSGVVLEAVDRGRAEEPALRVVAD